MDELGRAAGALAGDFQSVNPLALLEKLGPSGILLFLIVREIASAIRSRRNGGRLPVSCPIEPELRDHFREHRRLIETQTETLKDIRANTQQTRDAINRLVGQGRSGE